jgi:hypothetical protein
VETIYCFSAAPMVIGVRHRLQHELRETHDVHVEILDRAWLAEELADPEIFWIAEEYLSLPAAPWRKYLALSCVVGEAPFVRSVPFAERRRRRTHATRTTAFASLRSPRAPRER